VKSFQDEKFYQLLTPRLKNKLVFELLGQYYKKFHFFFHDIQTRVSADDIFIRKVLTSLDCMM